MPNGRKPLELAAESRFGSAAGRREAFPLATERAEPPEAARRRFWHAGSIEQRKIEIGREYGLREPAVAMAPLQHVRVLERVRPGRWRVEWLEPNAGLVGFVLSSNIVVPWAERDSFLRDEQRHQELLDDNRAHWLGHDHPLAGAVLTVLDSTGEVMQLTNAGILCCSPDALERVADRAGVSLSGAGYRSRHHVYHLPFSAALELAKGFAAAEPLTVLRQAEVEERFDDAEAREPGNAFLVPVVNKHSAERALVRQWAGQDAAIAAREEEIERLRQLLRRTVWDLRSDSCDPLRVAERITRSLQGR